MKICLFSTSFFPKIGGAEFAIHYIAKYLTKLGYKVVVLVPQYRGVKEETESNYEIHRYKLLPQLLFLEPTLIAHLSLERIKKQFDILHCHFAYPPGYCGIHFRKIFKIPVVVTLHGADIQKMPDINYGIRLNPKIDKKVKIAIRKADAITAISSSIKEEIIKVGGDRHKIYDIPNGVETWRFNEPVKKNVRGIFGLSKETKIILSVGRNHPKKGYTDLLKGLPKVLSRFPDVKCVIVGKGTESLKPLIKELKIENTVVLTGPIPKDSSNSLKNMNYPHPDLISIYLSSDIFVLPSLLEGFTLVIPEAMTAGLPVIVTDIPGSRDIIKNGVNGLLVPPSSPEALARKIIELLENDNLRNTISQNAKMESKRYDWKIIVKKYIDVYQNVLEKNKK